MTEELSSRQLCKPFFPLAEPESLSADGAISLLSYMTELSGNVTMTLADGLVDCCLKSIQTQGGANATITCSMDQSGGAYVGFSLGANNKALLIWDDPGEFWGILDSKGLTKNT